MNSRLAGERQGETPIYVVIPKQAWIGWGVVGNELYGVGVDPRLRGDDRDALTQMGSPERSISLD